MVQLFVKKRYNTPEEKALSNAIEELDEDKDKLVEYAEGLHLARSNETRHEPHREACRGAGGLSQQLSQSAAQV